jgi:glycogen debranching enzyme
VKPADTLEWLEADGAGGFASGTASGVRTRRYHALLLAAATPPTGRYVLVNGFEAWVETAAGSHPITSQRYVPGVLHPDGAERIEKFGADPWPRWIFAVPGGLRIEHEIFVARGVPLTAVRWRLAGPPAGAAGVRLAVRLLLSGRDYHALHHENSSFRFEPERSEEGLIWRPYPGVPAAVVASDAEYEHAPVWYRNFLYAEEAARGLDCVEDLASPGILRWDLSRGEAALLVSARIDGDGGAGSRRSGDEVAGAAHEVAAHDVAAHDVAARARGDRPVARRLARLRAAEASRRAALGGALERAADAYVVRRGKGSTIVAGYPWFTDWGRDTFIALRGVCLATGPIDEARRILLEWAGAVSEGMLPNRFPDRGEAPEYNSVDASLWYVVAVGETLRAAEAAGRPLLAVERRRLVEAVEAILEGYSRGTRYGIGAGADGLLAAGVPGVQLTWMDAKVGEWVVTPRIGKPVEVQALWANALAVGAGFSGRWQQALARARSAFGARFWNAAGGYLYDVVDADHQPGKLDASFRPNQIFAVGGLPVPLLEGEPARSVVDAVERRLWTPLGPRSLAPGEPGYAPRYEGGPGKRDAAYHQGTVWPWLAGPFVEAWLRVRGGGAAARREARRRFLAPLIAHLGEAGLGHVSEIADAEPPHTPRGCPFQAWSVGELLRIDRLLAEEAQARPARAARPGRLRGAAAGVPGSRSARSGYRAPASRRAPRQSAG